MNFNPKQMAVEQALKNTDALGHLANIIAGLESELLTEVKALQDALDVEHIEEIPEAEDRKNDLEALAKAQLSGGLESYYRDRVLNDRVDNPERAAGYLDMDDDEWQEQIEQWANSYRSGENSFEGVSDREIAAHHVEAIFAVSLPEFEQNVVNWQPGDLMSQVLAGNFRAAREGIRHCREEVQNAD